MCHISYCSQGKIHTQMIFVHLYKPNFTKEQTFPLWSNQEKLSSHKISKFLLIKNINYILMKQGGKKNANSCFNSHFFFIPHLLTHPPWYTPYAFHTSICQHLLKKAEKSQFLQQHWQEYAIAVQCPHECHINFSPSYHNLQHWNIKSWKKQIN